MIQFERANSLVMSGILEPLVSGPVMPATFLLAVFVTWSLFSLLVGWNFDVDSGATDGLFGDGQVDLDGVDSQLPSTADLQTATDSLGSWGMMTLRWLRLSEVPLLIWLDTMAITWWLISLASWLVIDQQLFGAVGVLGSILLAARNLLIAVFITRAVVPRVNLRLNPAERALTPQSLIGRECHISSLEANSQFGQVKFPTEGAPLLLNVRTDGPHLTKGTRVWITHYDAERRIYIVSPTTT